MVRKIFSITLALVMIASFLGVPAAQAGQPLPNRLNPTPVANPSDGGVTEMSVQEFLANNPGNIPHALEKFANTPVEVILELSQAPLAALVVQANQASAPMAPRAQQTYVAELQAAQAPVVAGVKAMGGMVFGQFTKGYNGIHIRLPANKVADAAKLPGVVAVHRVNRYTVDLKHSVPLINADKVWTDPTLKFTGKGVRVAVIDTGIDFTHAALGGSGNPADYEFQALHSDIISGTVFNTKVIWGYDFAGAHYGTTGIPVPDPNPIDFVGHGTHVASTIAGLGSTSTGKGVAPDAELYAVKVFGDDGGSTGLVPEAIEWTLDPNQDGIMDDHANVINMSLGSAFAPSSPTDPEGVMANYASALGIVVVASAGNNGNYPYATGFPGSADGVLSVAATAVGFLTGPGLGIQGSSSITLTNILYTPTGSGTPQFSSPTTAVLGWAGKLPGAANDYMCDTTGIAANSLAGKIALVQRGPASGGCGFSVKVNNAASLGAVGVIVYNHSVGGDTMVNMSVPGTTIPAVFVWRSSGLNLSKANGQTVAIQPSDTLTPISVPDPAQPADSIASFSSRGPRGYDSKLKPEISGPGLNIYAAAAGSGQAGVSMSGTSMASPHVAGVAALLRQKYPTWSSEGIKALLMNTSKDVQVIGASGYTLGLDLARFGAGRVDALAAAKSTTLAVGDFQLVSLNWGYQLISTKNWTDTKYIRLSNLGTTAKTYTVTAAPDNFSFTTGVTVTVPATVTVEGKTSLMVPVNILVNAAQVASKMDAEQIEEYAGLVKMTNEADPTDEARVPYYIVPRPYSQVVLTDLSAPGSTDAVATLAQASAINPHQFSYAMPMMIHMAPDRASTPAGDLRAFGIDYSFRSATNGDILMLTYNTYGDWHVQQTYFVEFDTYFDTDFDGVWDYVTFNWNFGSASGASRDGQYITALINLKTNALSVMPYTTYSDFNAGFMEQYIPVQRLGLSNRLVGGHQSFAYQIYSYGENGYGKASPVKAYNYNNLPMYSGMNGSNLEFGVANLESFNLAKPAGVMFIDYNGMPGEGQVVAIDYDFGYRGRVFTPFLSNQP